MSDPVIFLRKWIGEVSFIQWIFLIIVVDVCRNSQYQFRIVSLGSILHD